MARQVAVKLDLDAQKYITSAVAVRESTKAVDDEMKALGREADATGRDLDELAAQAALAKSQVDDLGDASAETSADLKKLEKGTDEAKASVTELGAATDDTSFSLGELGKSTKVSQESIRDWSAKSKEAAEAAKALEARISALKVSVRDLSLEFAVSGDEDVGKKLSSEKSLLGRLTRLRTEIAAARKEADEFGAGLAGSLVGAAGNAVEAGSEFGAMFSKGLNSALDSLGPGKGILFGTLIGGAVLAAPAIASIIGGALTGGVGAVAMAGGLLAAAHDDRVKAAAKDFGKNITDELFADGSMFVKPAIEGLRILETAFQGLHIGDALEKVVPTVTVIAKGVADFATNIMPGLLNTLDRVGPFAEVTAKGLGQLGTSLGTFLDDVSSSPGALEGLITAFGLLGGTVVLVGKGIEGLENTYDSMLQVEERLYAGLTKLAEATNADAVVVFADKMHSLFENLLNADDAAINADRSIRSLTPGMSDAGSAAGEYADATKSAVEWTHNMTDAFDALHGKTLDADEALLAAKKSVDDVSESFKKNGKSIQGNTEAALENRIALGHMADLAAAAAQSYYDLTGDVVGANKIMSDQKVIAEAATGATGKQRDAVNKLADSLFTIPAYTKANIDVVTTYSYRGTPTQVRKQDILDVEEKFRLGARASGGPVGQGTYMVGEKGPEILTLGSGASGYVYSSVGAWQSSSAGQSNWRTASVASGGGRSNVNVMVSAAPGADSKLLAGVIEYLRFTVDNNFSGNAQAALTRRRG